MVASAMSLDVPKLSILHALVGDDFQVRFMVRKPMVVDDSMNDDMDDDDLDLAEGAAGGGNQTSAAAAPADGDAPADKKKSVRLAAEGGVIRLRMGAVYVSV